MKNALKFVTIFAALLIASCQKSESDELAESAARIANEMEIEQRKSELEAVANPKPPLFDEKAPSPTPIGTYRAPAIPTLEERNERSERQEIKDQLDRIEAKQREAEMRELSREIQRPVMDGIK